MRVLRPWLGAVALAVALAASACTSDDSGTAATSSPPASTGATGEQASVRFGAFNFTESTILAEIYAQAAIAAGVPAEVVPDVGPREVVYPQLFDGDLAVVPEYAGSAVVALGGEATSDSSETHDTLVGLMQKEDVAVLDAAPAVNRNAVAVTLDTATRLNLRKMSDLTSVAPDLTLGGPAECPDRPLCIPGLASTYGVQFKDFVALDPGVQTAASLAQDEVGAALVFTTDASISVFALVLLDDDKGLYPAENVTPLVRREVLDRYPELTDALDKVSAALTTRELRALNYTVAIVGEEPAKAAQTWLEDKGLI